MSESRKPNSIPLHHLTSSPFLVFTIESTNDETFDGLHRHDFFELIWFTKTDSNETVEIDFMSYQLNENDICLLSPGQVFRMRKTIQRGYVMAFANEVFYELLDSSSLYNTSQVHVRLDTDVLETIQCLLSLILKEYKHQKRMALLKPYLSAFLFHVVAGPSIQQKEGDSRINELLQLIGQHYLQQREARFYADQLNVSLKHLNALVKKERGITVKEFILQRLILEAKREIHFGKLTFKEIAFKLGFNDPAYFSRFFKVQTGLSAE
jgi:AraC-like DNA-binding protein